MAKVLIMVERDGRVVCAGRAHRVGFNSRGLERVELATITPDTTEWLYGSSWQSRRMDAADRWWLVEAESAAAARHVISVHPGHIYQDTRLVGMVLASGGKR